MLAYANAYQHTRGEREARDSPRVRARLHLHLHGLSAEEQNNAGLGARPNPRAAAAARAAAARRRGHREHGQDDGPRGQRRRARGRVAQSAHGERTVAPRAPHGGPNDRRAPYPYGRARA